MTGDEFKQALRELGWKQADLCRKAAIHKNTAVGWAANGAPQWVAEYLGALLAIKRLHDTFILAPPRERLNNESGSDEPGEEGRAVRRAAELNQLRPAADSIKQGLQEAIAHARGDAITGVHVPHLPLLPDGG